MASDVLVTVVQEDHQQLLDRLKALQGAKGDGSSRDEFLDDWVGYGTAVGLVLFDAAREHLEDGQALVDQLRDEAEGSGFKKKFTTLENADDDAIAAAAKETAPSFKAETDRTMSKLVLPLERELDEDVLADVAKRYREHRAAP